MDRTFWLVPGQIAGRPGPDREPWNLGALKAAGIDSVISVNDGRECHPGSFASQGMTYACVPLPDNVPPAHGDEEIVVQGLPRIYDFMAKELASGRCVLVHCSSGKDRTALALAYYLVRHDGLSIEAAIDAVRRVRPIALSAEGWSDFAVKVLHLLGRDSATALDGPDTGTHGRPGVSHHRLAVLGFVALGAIVAGAITTTLTVAGPGPASLDRVSWLQGCWQAQSPRRLVEENWMAPRGGTMIGVSRTVRGDSLLEYELVLVREIDGVLNYEAHPSGQEAALFPLKEMTDSSIVFEDPEHDYPQEIGYRTSGPDSLIAWIDGRHEGKSRRVEFPYVRVRCPGP